MTGRLFDSFPLAAVEETVSLPEEPRLHASPGQSGTLLDIYEQCLTSLFLAILEISWLFSVKRPLGQFNL